MALSDVLAARAARKGRSAAVECGELGTLTVEALPVRECAALLRGPGEGRAVLYAACRELQAEGEALRKKGELFRPDEIMDFVSEEEISAAVQAVLALSGLESGTETGLIQADTASAATAGMALEQDGAQAVETTTGMRPEAPLKTGLTNDSPGAGISATDGGALPLEVLERIWEMHGEADSRSLSKVRPETVQEFAQAVPEFRREAVRENGAALAGAPAEERAEEPVSLPTVVKQSTEIRPETVQNPEQNWGTEPLLEADGQVSREFAEAQNASKKALPELFGKERPQIMGGIPSDGPQNLEDVGRLRMVSNGAVRTEEGLPRKEAPENLHETESDIMETGGVPLHEMESEFWEGRQKNMHEITSDFPRERANALHESRSDFQERMHEIESEFPGDMHESKSDFPKKDRETLHESESELAERVARRLLEGLRRAAAVR